MSDTPIRGLRVMAIVRWAVLAATVAVAGFSWWTFVASDGGVASGPDRYHCPMHPQIRSPNPGTCPICFMNLEPIPRERLDDHPESHEPPTPSEGLGAEVSLSLERRQAIGVATTRVDRRVVSRELRLPALVEIPEAARFEVRSRAPGYIERVAQVESGDRVRAGQPLAWIYSTELLTAQEELLAAHRLSGANLSGTSISGASLASTVSGAARDRLLVLGVHRSDVDRILASGHAERAIPLRAPATATVTRRSAAVGSYATPDAPLFELADLSSLWITATAATGDLEDVGEGVSARFVPRGGQARDVEVLLVSPTVSTDTRSGRVRLSASNEDGTLRPGDIGEVVLSLAPRELVLVPRDAVIDRGSLRYVFVEERAGVFSPREVDVGPLVGDERVLRAGVEPGEVVVTRGAFLVDSESRLEGALAPQSRGTEPEAESTGGGAHDRAHP
jgi:Cu(I)/Ag(I) efflux system membrane fusion protein